VSGIPEVAALACGSPAARLLVAGTAISWTRSGGRTIAAENATDGPLDTCTRNSATVFEVADVTADGRFNQQPVVAGVPVVSYAGARIVSADGRTLGTLAVVDGAPRRLNATQRAALLALAGVAGAQLDEHEALVVARALVESAPVAIYHTDGNGHVTYANPEYRRLCSLAPDDDLHDWAQGVHPDDRSRMDAAWDAFRQQPGPMTIEWRSAPRDGAVRVLAEQVVAANDIAGFVGTITDITERVAASASLQRIESLFRNTIEQTPIGIAYSGRNGLLLRYNKAFCELLGYELGDLDARSVQDLTFEQDVAQTSANIERLWRGDVAFVDFEKRYLRKDGSVCWTRVTKALIRDETGVADCSVEFLRDISARKELERALTGERALLAAVLANVPFAILACDATGEPILCNQVATDLFEMRRSEETAPGARVAYPTHLGVFLPDGVTPVAREARPLARALRGESVSNVELVIVKAGDVVKATRCSARQLVGPHGECLGAVAVTQDVTQMKSLERDLAQSQKLESIGQLAAGIAHEINTPTQFIGDNIRFLQDSFDEVLAFAARLAALPATPAPPGDAASALEAPDLAYLRDEIPKAIVQSLEGVDRIARIVSAMKEFSHPGMEKSPVDLNRAITSTITVATNEWKYVADVRTDFDPALPAVPVMPGAFNQVILNILVNAAHAIGGTDPHAVTARGTITISTRRIDDWAEIRIADSGCGMPTTVVDRIFDPFFTTKPLGKGTGQGLAIAHDVIVKKHGGTISVDSLPGVGTTFVVRLPLVAASADAVEAA
jgi:PAS domain S-box-containing protein